MTIRSALGAPVALAVAVALAVPGVSGAAPVQDWTQKAVIYTTTMSGYGWQIL